MKASVAKLVTCFRYDTGQDKLIDFEELKHMMEKLGSPQTHLALKGMIREVDEDHDNCISFREVGTVCCYRRCCRRMNRRIIEKPLANRSEITFSLISPLCYKCACLILVNLYLYRVAKTKTALHNFI